MLSLGTGCLETDLLLFVVGNCLLLGDFLLLGAHHRYQLVGVLVLDRQLLLLSSQLALQVVHLQRGTGPVRDEFFTVLCLRDSVLAPDNTNVVPSANKLT